MMARKKNDKLDFSNMEPLTNNPFASLGGKLKLATPKSAKAEQAIAAKPATKPARPKLLIRMEKRRNGRMATCIYHLGKEAEVILKKLKTRLGTGGSLGEKCMELQGDHRDFSKTFFETEGYKVRMG